jgi:alanine-synthesizing transaminase
VFSQRGNIDRRRNRLAIALQQARVNNRSILDLTVSNPIEAGFLFPPAELLAALKAPAALEYDPQPLGLVSARQAISRHMAGRGLAIDPDRIIITASTSEAYGFVFKLLCDPGDEVLVPRPSYPLLEHLAGLESVRIVHYDLHYDGSWYLSAESIARSRSERTRALVLVNPNNPTGSYVKADEIERLADLGLPLISDEVFFDYPLEEGSGTMSSALRCERALVFALFGLSKQAALPQMKLSWICGSGPGPQLGEAWERLELIADSYLSVATPVQVALPDILRLQEEVQQAIRQRLRRNLARLRDDGSSLRPLRVEGGWYAPLRLPPLRDDEQWALELLREEGVLVHPGYLYDFTFGPVVVASLLTPEEVFDEGLQRIARRVDG